MDLYELSKQLGNDIIIRYNPKTDEFTAELEDVCAIEIALSEAYGTGRCRKDALLALIDVIHGKELFGANNNVKVPDDIKIPTGL